MTADARLHPRAQASIQVEFQFGGTSGVGTTNDVSEGGIFLETDVVAETGSRIYLRLYLPSDESVAALEIVGIVRRSSSGDGAAPGGMGIRFEIAHAKTRGALGEFIGAITLDPAAPRESALPPRPRLPSNAEERASESSGGLWVWGLGLTLVVLAVLRLYL
ncbi:MAG: PilZ domain-containing protein [Deltaproteobacteria bacterium]|nr:PilZ domain-containing protein [Deltaproteobacteria bacterium]